MTKHGKWKFLYSLPDQLPRFKFIDIHDVYTRQDKLVPYRKGAQQLFERCIAKIWPNGENRYNCCHDHIHQAIHHHVDDLERRIGELAEADRRAAERPLLDGDEVMERLGLGPGPEVGKALKFLMELRRSQPSLGREETEASLDDWWRDYQS